MSASLQQHGPVRLHETQEEERTGQVSCGGSGE